MSEDTLMAKVIGPLHASEARGKAGGLVYNTWRGFATVKAKHAPAQPRSAKQLAVRAVAIMLVRKWADLTNQADWNAYATAHPLTDWTNSPKRLSGANWYVMLNLRQFRNMGVTVDTPPVVNAPDPVTDFNAVGGADLITVSWSSPSGANDRIEFWLDGPHTAGRQGSLPRAKFKVIKEGDQTGTTITGLLNGVYTVYARVVSIVDGQVSLYVSHDATVT
jgi:hypothetical protein